MNPRRNPRAPTLLLLTVLLTLAGGGRVGLASAVGPASSGGLAGSVPQQALRTYSEYGEKIAAARAVVLERMDGFPGLSVSVGIDGQVVWAEGFGWADLEQRVPVRATSRFRVGSVAKPMTAALLGLLHEEGRIDLDATVQTYVPDFPEKEHPITVRQLAGHLAGIRHYQGDEFLNSAHYETVSDGLSIFADDPLLFEPGTRYSYSSYGWNLLSAVIEGATGEGFLEQMQRRVFEPLGMLDTTPDQNEMIVADRVRPYVRGEDGRFRNAPYVDNSYKWAGGGFLSTPEDLVRFGLAHMRPGFLEAETLDEWFTSQHTTDGEETGYGIGWRVSGQEGSRRVGHGGGSVGGTTTLAVYRDQGLVIAMVTNSSDGGGFPVDEIAGVFLRGHVQTSQLPPGMVLVPGGSLMMGDADGQDMEKPVHEVELDAFYMDAYEVTLEKFGEFVEATGYLTDAEKNGGSTIWNGEEWAMTPGVDWRFDAAGNAHTEEEKNQPVTHLSWNDANAYCQSAGKRLPTEAEWEYAARGGERGYKFAWGNEPLGTDVVANVSDENFVKVVTTWPYTEGYDDGYVFGAPVGSFPPNALGLYDMSGNAWEWCADYFDAEYYSRSPRENPRNDDPNERRVMRGNSWDGRPGLMRASRRTSDLQSNTYADTGFRCAKDIG